MANYCLFLDSICRLINLPDTFFIHFPVATLSSGLKQREEKRPTAFPHVGLYIKLRDCGGWYDVLMRDFSQNLIQTLASLPTFPRSHLGTIPQFFLSFSEEDGV